MQVLTRDQFKAVFSKDIQTVLFEVIDRMHEPHKDDDFLFLQSHPESGMRRKFFFTLESTHHLGVLMNLWLNNDGHMVARMEELYLFRDTTEMLIAEARDKGATNDPKILN